MTEIAARFIPVFLIIFLGIFLRYKSILSGDIVDGLKKLVITVGLPAVFFQSFLTMELKQRYLLLFVGTFLCCLLLFFLGKLLYRLKIVRMPLSAFFFTGFEFGMVGVALFSSIFGTENLHYILLLGLGHEFFIWFVYAPLLEAQNHGSIQIGKIIKSFLSSPIILAILSALLLNLTGWYQAIQDYFWMNGILAATTTAGNITTPLILLVVGYQLKFTAIEWKTSGIFLAARIILVAVIGILFFLISDAFIMEMNRYMQYAFLTFFLLPPPYIIPVFLGKGLKKESVFYTNLLVLYTLVTLILYAGTMFIIGL